MNNSPSGSTDDLFSLALNSNTAFSFGAATAGDAPLSVQRHIDRVSGLVPDSSQAHTRPPFLGAQPPAQPQPQPQPQPPAPFTPAQQLDMMNMMVTLQTMTARVKRASGGVFPSTLGTNASTPTATGLTMRYRRLANLNCNYRQ